MNPVNSNQKRKAAVAAAKIATVATVTAAFVVHNTK